MLWIRYYWSAKHDYRTVIPGEAGHSQMSDLEAKHDAPAVSVANGNAVPALLSMTRAFYALEHISIDEQRSRKALTPLLGESDLGRVYLIALDDETIGYCVVCFGYSLEFGGRDAFIDEIFLEEAHRGKGYGKIVLEQVADEARALGVMALYLEVERNNAPAQKLYDRAGFEKREKYFLMTRYL